MIKIFDYIVLCKLESHTISGCRVTGVGPPMPPPPLVLDTYWDILNKKKASLKGQVDGLSCNSANLRFSDL